MNEKKKQDKGQELQSMGPHNLPSPFGKSDLFSDSGFFKEMDQFFEDYLPRRWWHHLRHGWPSEAVSQQYMAAPFEGKTPSVDIIDREADFLVKAELPGVDKKDINITIANNTVTLQASVNKEEKEEKADYYRQEICRGSYRRTLDLPVAVKENEAKATFKNGILELIIPKLEKTKKSTIKVD